MFTLRLVKWLDEVDPYSIQRIALHKALFIATMLVYVYWIFRPGYYSTFISPIIVASLYELPSVSSVREKERFLLLIFSSVLICSATFYLIYPFRVVFFFYAVFILSVLYFWISARFGQLKNITMLLIATSAISLEAQPPGNWQVVYDLCSSGLLSMFTIFFCLKIYPNQSLTVWRRAMQRFLRCMEQSIEAAIHKQEKTNFSEEVAHLGVIRAFRRLIPKQDILHTGRISIYIRNIQFALDNLYDEPKNDAFWDLVQKQLCLLRKSMQDYRPCLKADDAFIAETAIQRYVARCLMLSISRWNQLCKTHKR